MKSDLYLKTVLTLIAICLVYLCIHNANIIPQAMANHQPEKLFNTPNYGLVPLNEDGSITVKFAGNAVMDVNISRISTSDEMDVNIDEIGGSTSRVLKVDLKEISSTDELDVNIAEVSGYQIIGGKLPVKN